MEIINLFGGIYQGKKIFLTGHTGFKGSWLSILLHELGAKVYGYALVPNTTPSLYNIAGVDGLVKSTIGDIRNYDFLLNTMHDVQPDIVIHMAAQPLVRESYKTPRETYETNVMGTVNLFEAVRHTKSVKVLLNVTSDKCYENKEWVWGYRENETMGGYDPYSNSKSCSELVTASFRSSFFNPSYYSKHGVAVASARAGNVIGGGDYAEDRLIPDFIRAISKGESVKIRNPKAIRPWQHVLEPIAGYLTLCEKLLKEGASFSEGWNFGSDDSDAKDVEWIIKKLCTLWGEGATYEIDPTPQLHEATYLKLDCSKAKTRLQWYPKWSVEKTLETIVKFNQSYKRKETLEKVCRDQINDFFFK